MSLRRSCGALGLALLLLFGLMLAGGEAWAVPPPTLEVQTIGLGTVTGSGISCGASSVTCATAYGTSSTSVTLTATPAAGWAFDHWDDGASICGTATTCAFSATGDTFATAVFKTASTVQLATLNTSVTQDTSGTSPVAEGTITDPSTDSAIACPSSCTTQVLAGSTLTMKEAPSSGTYFFHQWAGGCSGTQEWCSVYLPAGTQSLTADFVKAGTTTLTVIVEGGGTVAGAGITCAAGSTCTVQEPSNGSFILTATAHTGYTFDHWENDCAGAQTTCTVDTSQDRTVTAVFTQVVPLLVTVNGDGTVIGDSMTCGPGPQTCSGNAAPGTDLQFEATPATTGGTVTWQGCTSAAGTLCNVVVGSSPISITVTFSGGTTGGGGGSFVTLGVTVSGDGYVTGTSGSAAIYCSAAGGSGCSVSVQQGSSIVLHAVPASGSFADFTTGWGGSCSGTSLTCTVSMTSTKQVTADFFGDDTTQNLTVAVVGSGSVAGAGLNCRVTGSAGCTSPQAADATVIITAVPAAGQTFSGWSGDCSGSSTQCTVTMDDDHNVIATFKSIALGSVKLSLTVGGFGTVTGGDSPCVGKGTKPATCTSTERAGVTVDLRVVPARGWVFAGWTGACTGAKPSCTLILNANSDVTATFTPASITSSTVKPRVVKTPSGFRIILSFRAREAGRLTVTTTPKTVTIAKTIKAGAGSVRITVRKRGRYVVTLSLHSKSGTHKLHYTVKV